MFRNLLPESFFAGEPTPETPTASVPGFLSGLPVGAVVKDTRIRERLTVQFRAELFNLLNRANFNTANRIVFTRPTAANLTGLSGTAEAITSTSTMARQVQFGLKVLW